MCVVVELAASPTSYWCREDAAIRVPADLSKSQMLTLTRVILGQLGALQPSESTMEARCYCGAPVTMWDLPETEPVVPRQRVHGLTEVHRGA